MFRTAVCLLAALIITVILLPFILIFKLISLFKPDGELPGAVGVVIRIVIPVIEWLAGVKFEVTGIRIASGTVAGNAVNCEADSAGTRIASDAVAGSDLNCAAIYVGNHQGSFDALVPLIHLGKTKSIVLKKEISKVPLAGWMLRFFGCIFLDRTSLKAQVACINEMEARLRAGKEVAVFPEGTRSQGPHMGEYKAGAFRAAIAAGVPVIPFVIDGSWHCWEEKHRLAPATVKLSILPPVSTDGLTTKDAKDLASRVQDLTQQELFRLRAEKGSTNA